MNASASGNSEHDSLKKEVEELVSKVWSRTIQFVTHILETHRIHSIDGFIVNLNPPLSEIVKLSQELSTAIGNLLEESKSIIEWDEFRKGINARECLLDIELLARAFEVNNKDECERIFVKLGKQSLLQ